MTLGNMRQKRRARVVRYLHLLRLLYLWWYSGSPFKSVIWLESRYVRWLDGGRNSDGWSLVGLLSAKFRLDKRAAKPLPQGPPTRLGTQLRGSPATTLPKPWRRVSLNSRRFLVIATLSSRLGRSTEWQIYRKNGPHCLLATGRGLANRTCVSRCSALLPTKWL
jgi:hypothetical protein